MELITAQPRSIRYLILVNGDVAQANGRRIDAIKRANVILATWNSAETIEVVDSWNAYPRLKIV